MSLWVVRAGRYGEQEETAVTNGLVCHAWNELPDYSALTKDELRKIYKEKYPAESEKQVVVGLGQVWRFANDIEIGDMVALPLKNESAFEFGRITGKYQYKQVAPNVMHIRTVEWLKKVPRSVFPEDILFSMNSLLTLFRVHGNDAETRVNKILAQSPTALQAAIESPSIENGVLADDETVDLAETARDEILKFIQAKFKGHGLANLVGAILRAQGYKTKVMPPGPDGAWIFWLVQDRSGSTSRVFVFK
jgi:restriction system protein